MSLLTKKVVMATFEEMIEEMPFDKITVSALVKRCEISSNTFYYNYRDIYALLEEWFAFKLSKLDKGTENNTDWRAESKDFLHYCQDHPKIVYHIFESLSRAQLEHYVFTRTEDSFTLYVNERTAESGLPDMKKDEITQFCRYAFMGFFLKFIWNKMRGDIDEDVDRLGEVFDNFIYGEISREGYKISN